MATEFALSNVEIISSNEHGESIAIKRSTNRYYMGDIDGEIFCNAFNVKLAGGIRDDAAAVRFFSEKYGYEQ